MRRGLSLMIWYRYLQQKVSYASHLTLQKSYAGQIVPKDVWNSVLKNVFMGEMLYFYRNKGLEMEPTISGRDTVVVRKLGYLNSGLRQYNPQIYTGDVVVLKDPADSEKHVIRRVAAVEGHEMVSTKKEDEPFVIERDQCWVLSDNPKLQPRESKDSRTYGPISITDIVGRVIFRFRSLKDNDLVMNNKVSMGNDLPVLYVELDSEKLHQFAEEANEPQDHSEK